MLNSSKSMMNYQYQLNKALADENRNWQERMANSAHQREIADLKAAGLNPVLTVTGGNGANTPTGSTASVSDGAGYASALANLEAAQINSAAQLFMHTTPSASTPLGQFEYLAGKLGLDTAESYANVVQSFSDLITGSAKGNSLFSKRNERIMNDISITRMELAKARLDGNKRKIRKYERQLKRYSFWYPNVYREYQKSKNK